MRGLPVSASNFPQEKKKKKKKVLQKHILDGNFIKS